MSLNDTYQKELETLLKEYPIHDQITFNEFNILEKLEKNTFLYIQYEDLHYREISKLEHYKMLLEKLVGKLYDEMRFNNDKILKKEEIEKYYIPQNDKYIKMVQIIKQQEHRVNFFKLCANSINKQSWAMKSWLEARRL